MPLTLYVARTVCGYELASGLFQGNPNRAFVEQRIITDVGSRCSECVSWRLHMGTTPHIPISILTTSRLINKFCILFFAGSEFGCARKHATQLDEVPAFQRKTRESVLPNQEPEI